MKKIFSIGYSDTGFNVTVLLLRLCFGLFMIAEHGIPKLMQFADLSTQFYDPFGIGKKWALILALFAEVFCSIFVVLGLFTRLAVIPLIITMCVAIFGANKGNIQGSELAMLYLTVFLFLLWCGPGRISVDGMMRK